MSPAQTRTTAPVLINNRGIIVQEMSQPERIEALEIGEGGALLAVASRLTGNNWDSELLIWTDVGPRPPPGRPSQASILV